MGLWRAGRRQVGRHDGMLLGMVLEVGESVSGHRRHSNHPGAI